jgi:hypothetical protein
MKELTGANWDHSEIEGTAKFTDLFEDRAVRQISVFFAVIVLSF